MAAPFGKGDAASAAGRPLRGGHWLGPCQWQKLRAFLWTLGDCWVDAAACATGAGPVWPAGRACSSPQPHGCGFEAKSAASA